MKAYLSPEELARLELRSRAALGFTRVEERALITAAVRLNTLLARLGDISEFECGHGVPFSKPCYECGASAVVAAAEKEPA